QPDAGAMTWEQLAQLAGNELITLGAHTISHPVLAALSAEELDAEVAGSKQILARYRSFANVFAYPYGDVEAIGEEATEAVRRAGLAAAFTTSETALSSTEDPMHLGRVCVDDMSL